MHYIATNELDTKKVSYGRNSESADYIHLLRVKARVFGYLADQIIHASTPCIFDVSRLAAKLPDHSVANFTLGDIAIPGHVSRYLHFGCQDTLLIDRTTNRRFEGAYIRQEDLVSHDGPETVFRVTIVSSDPLFSKARHKQAESDTLVRNVEAIAFDVSNSKTVSDGFKTIVPITPDAGSLPADYKTCMRAYELAIKSMLYLAEAKIDVEPAYAAGADPKLAAAALDGDRRSAVGLLQRGYPMVQAVGRHTGRILRLTEPDWVFEDEGFGM